MSSISSNKILTKYDITVVFQPDLSKDSVRNITKSFLQNLKFWNCDCYEALYLGKKSFAYPIKKEVNGIFVVLKISSNPAAINRFQKTLRQNELVLRNQIIKQI